MIKLLVDRFDSLTGREKTIFITTLVVLAWGAWDKLFYQPIAAQHKQIKTELSSIKIQLSALLQQITQITALGELDPNSANRQKLKEVKAEIKRLKQRLDIGSKKFVPAKVMVEVLGDILQKNRGLKLVHLETLPVSTLPILDQKQSWVYRHGLSLTLSGNYFNTLNYLKSLEALPWRLNWGAIDYQVKDYPVAETILQVYTLSYEENWLGL